MVILQSVSQPEDFTPRSIVTFNDFFKNQMGSIQNAHGPKAQNIAAILKDKMQAYTQSLFIFLEELTLSEYQQWANVNPDKLQ